MVVTPEEAREFLSRADKKKMNDLEKKIDKTLLSGQRTFDLSSEGYDRAVQALMKQYREAGWKVEYESNQRDGSYLNFKEGRDGR